MLVRLILATVFGCFVSQVALATPVQYGVGLSVRAGSYAGFSSSGASLDLRLGKISLEGTVMQGDQDIKSDLDNDLWGIFDFSDKNYTISKATIRQRAVAAQLKFHPMNGSFYFGFGGGQTTGTAKLEAEGDVPGETLDEQLIVKRNLSTLAIGNVWTPGGVMIGCEWGAIASASNIKKEATSQSSPGDNADLLQLKEDFEDKVVDYSGKSTTHLLVVYLGFMLGA